MNKTSNKLYTYDTETYRLFRGWVKVGGTEKTVEERVKQQDGTSCPEPLDVGGEWNLGKYTDKDIHKILEKKWRRVRGKSREWFEFPVGFDYRSEISKAVNELLHGLSKSKSFGMRDEQSEAAEKCYSYFNDGGKSFLYNCIMRFGKTFTTYQTMVKLNAKKVLILSYKTATDAAWENDLKEHIDFEKYSFYHARKQPKLLDDLGDYSVIFASFQDILGKVDNGKLKKKFEKLLKSHFDLIVIDEVHFGGDKDKAQMFIDTLDYSKRLDLSGTPYRLLMLNSYTSENTYTFSYEDEQEKRQEEKRNGWKTEVYRWLPKLHLYTFQLDNMTDSINEYYTEEEKLTLTKFFGSDDGETFNNVTAVNEWLDNICCQIKRKISNPYNSTDIENMGGIKHTLWYMSDVNSCKAMKRTLEKHTFFSDYKIIPAYSNNEGEGADTLQLVHNGIKDVKSNNTSYKGSITLSCGKLNTGVSIRDWNGVFMLSNTIAGETYFQTIFRCKTPNKNARKEDCFVFDFAPDRCLEMIYNYNEMKMNASTEDVGKQIRRFLDCAEVLQHKGNHFVELEDVNEIITVGESESSLYNKMVSERLVDSSKITVEMAEQLCNIKCAKGAKSKQIINENSGKGKTFGIEGNDTEKIKLPTNEMNFTKGRIIQILSDLYEYIQLSTDKGYKCINDILNTSDIQKNVFEDIVGISLDIFDEYCIKTNVVAVSPINRVIALSQ